MTIPRAKTVQRFFIAFRANTTLHNKLMVISEANRHLAWEAVAKQYPLAIATIYTEPEASIQIGSLYNAENNWINFGTECLVYEQNPKTGTIDDKKVIAKYPINK